MIDEHIDEYGEDFELQEKIVTSSDWQGDVFDWTKEKDIIGVLKLASGKDIESLEKLSIQGTHKFYCKRNEITALDTSKRLKWDGKTYYITYIDPKMPNYCETVNHIKVFVEERENE